MTCWTSEQMTPTATQSPGGQVSQAPICCNFYFWNRIHCPAPRSEFPGPWACSVRLQARVSSSQWWKTILHEACRNVGFVLWFLVFSYYHPLHPCIHAVLGKFPAISENCGNFLKLIIFFLKFQQYPCSLLSQFPGNYPEADFTQHWTMLGVCCTPCVTALLKQGWMIFLNGGWQCHHFDELCACLCVLIKWLPFKQTCSLSMSPSGMIWEIFHPCAENDWNESTLRERGWHVMHGRNASGAISCKSRPGSQGNTRIFGVSAQKCKCFWERHAEIRSLPLENNKVVLA